MTPLVDVIEFTDPGCPWCWGSEPTLRWLHQRYRDHVSWRRVFGVQMDGPAGADAPEPPEEVRGRWLQMAEHTGAPISVAKLDNGRVRYAFPTVIIRGPEGERVVPGWRPAAVYREAFEAVAPPLREVRDKALDPVQALERYRSLSDLDLELLTGRDEPPASGVLLPTATTPLWLHPSGRRVPRSSGPASSRGEASRMRHFYIKQFQSN